jgi:hypothetical protein
MIRIGAVSNITSVTDYMTNFDRTMNKLIYNNMSSFTVDLDSISWIIISIRIRYPTFYLITDV